MAIGILTLLILQSWWPYLNLHVTVYYPGKGYFIAPLCKSLRVICELGVWGGVVNGNIIEEIQHLTGYISHMCHCSNAVYSWEWLKQKWVSVRDLVVLRFLIKWNSAMSCLLIPSEQGFSVFFLLLSVHCGLIVGSCKLWCCILIIMTDSFVV